VSLISSRGNGVRMVAIRVFSAWARASAAAIAPMRSLTFASLDHEPVSGVAWPGCRQRPGIDLVGGVLINPPGGWMVAPLA
jgi:hypothetical protein